MDASPFATYDLATHSSALEVMPALGGEPRELVRVREPEGISDMAIAWTPDGRHLVYGVYEHLFSADATTQLWRIPAEGGEPRKLGLTPKALHELGIHPDGRRIAFGAGCPKGEVWVMENFLPVFRASR